MSFQIYIPDDLQIDGVDGFPGSRSGRSSDIGQPRYLVEPSSLPATAENIPWAVTRR